MTMIRRLGWASLALGFGHIVFGAIVRITGSGMGCGDHWPSCQGYLIPPFDRPELIIEVTHRYLAAALSLSVVSLLVVAIMRRRQVGVAGRGGVLRPVALALFLVIGAALFGAVVVKLELTNKAVIVTHLAIAMSLLGALVVAIVRAGGPPQLPEYAPAAFAPSPIPFASNQSMADDSAWTASARTARGAAVAAGLAFLALVLGALTAHVPGANTACQGFPFCSGSLLPTEPGQYVQFAHRLVAFALLGHLTGLVFGTRRRGERRMRALALTSVVLCLTQIGVAAIMVELRLPPVWKSLHEAVGTLLWIVVFGFALIARRSSLGEEFAGVPARRPPLTPLVSAESHG